MATCPNEQYILTALRNEEAPEEIPSFCQSLMGNITRTWMQKHEDDIEDEDVLFTRIGDFTMYKAVGYSSHWCGSPGSPLVLDDELRDYVKQKNKEIKEKFGNNYSYNSLGSIRASNKVTSWFVETGIQNEKELEFFLDHLEYKKPDPSSVDNWREGRLQCLKNNWVPFGSSHVVIEPANQSISFGLTSKLMRRNKDLINRFYDFILQASINQIEGLLKAGVRTLCTADDMAYKTGPMFHPKMYREFVMPRAKILCDMVREKEGVIFMHTDGLIDSVMDCFIDAGYHAIQPLEPTSGMTIERVKRIWGDKIACIGNTDTTNTLSFKTPKETRDEVHRNFREATGKDGKIKGYMFAASGSIHDGVQLENFVAMMDEYKKIRSGEVPI